MARRRSVDPWSTPEERRPLFRLLLGIVDRLSWLVRAFRIQPTFFRELLRVRLVLASRPTSAASNPWGLAGIALAIASSGFMGLMSGLIALLSESASLWIVVSQTALALILVLVLFQFLAGILVDPTDIGVVASHPVSDRALFAARLTEIFCLLLLFIIAFTAGNVILAVFAKPPLAVLLVYPLLSLLCGLTALGAVALLFAACLRTVGSKHFQRVTLWAQILSGVAVFGGLQLTRIMRREQWALWADQHRELLLLWPPFQYAELYSLLTGSGTRASAWPILAALLLPLVALGVTLWLASHSFVAGLQGTLSAPTPRAHWPDGVMAKLGRHLAPGLERCGYQFAVALSRREPHFLRTVVPQLVMYQAMAVGMGFGMHRDLSFFVPMSASFIILVLPNLLLQAQGTADPEAREIFVRAPLESEEALLRGGLKGLLLQWVGGPALVLFGVQLLIAGLESMPRILLAFGLTFVATLFLARRCPMVFPFTQAVRVGATGAANLGLALVSAFVIVLIGGVHFLLALHPISLWVGIVGVGWWVRGSWKSLDRIAIANEKRLRPVRVPVAHG